MKIPRGHKRLQAFLQETIDECGVSRVARMQEGKFYRDYLLKGTGDGSKQVIYNKCFDYTDNLSSTLFSPVDARYAIDYDHTDDEASLDMAVKGGKILTRDIQKTHTDEKFSQGVFWAATYGTMFLRDNWGHDGAEPNLIFPFQMGVLKENTNDIDRQEAFTIRHYITKGQFVRMVQGTTDEKDLIKNVMRSAASARKGEDFQDNLMSQLILSGINNAVSTTGTNQKQGSFLFGNAIPAFGPEVLAEMIELNETWVRDMDGGDDESMGDWVTYLSVSEHIIRGRYKKENLSGVKGETGITQIATRPIEGYFWGRSELAVVNSVQDEFVGRTNAYNRVAKMRANPARLAIGMNINANKYDAQNKPGGLLTDSSPNGKLESLAPEMPQEQEFMMRQVDEWFEQAGGFTKSMQGKGESGVRSDDHASSLIRTGSTRIRNKAINIERQYAEVGDFRLKLLAAKKATVYKTKQGIDFRLGDLPDDYRVSVDSHSSSPIFSEDNKQLALQLKKLGVIDSTTTVRMLHPPMEDEIVDTIARAEKTNQKLMEEAKKADPQSFWSSILGGKKKK